MIAWKYLNKPSATVAAMQDYSTMREIINITPQETKELYDRMVSVGSRRVTVPMMLKAPTYFKTLTRLFPSMT